MDYLRVLFFTGMSAFIHLPHDWTNALLIQLSLVLPVFECWIQTPVIKREKRASFYLTSVSELALCAKKKSCSCTILLFYKSPLFIRSFLESWFYFSGKSSSKHVSKFEDWFCFGLAQIKSLFSYRTHSKNLACKNFKLAFLTLGLDPPGFRRFLDVLNSLKTPVNKTNCFTAKHEAELFICSV